MTERQYSSIAGVYTLTSSINDTATSIILSATAGLPPAYPFTLVIDPGTTAEEIVTVTGLSGTTAAVIRGEDGSVAQSHQVGAAVRHMASARDFREPQQHINATVVHGVTSSLVGVSDTQTLQNKTLGDTTQVVVSGTPVSLSTTLAAAAAPTVVAALAHFGAKLAVSGGPQFTVWSSGDVVSDADGLWSAANPTRLTAKAAGVYLVSASWSGPAMESGATFSSLYRNGLEVARSLCGTTGTGVSGAMSGAVTFPLSLAIGDYLEASLATGASTGSPHTYSFTLMQIG